MNISGRSAIVTGAAGGLGTCFVSSLLQLGVKQVVAIDIDREGLDRLAADITDPRVLPKFLNIADESAVLELFREIRGQNIYPQILINNAGMLCDGLLVSKQGGFIRKLSSANWAQSLSTNLTGHFLMAREFAASVFESPCSSVDGNSSDTAAIIINISSISSAGNVGQSNYASAKAGLDASTKTWARELASERIRVCGVAPGFVLTEMLADIDPEEREKILSEIPLGRPGRVEDIWIAVKFAIECDYFTGRIVSVDGGSVF